MFGTLVTPRLLQVSRGRLNANTTFDMKRSVIGALLRMFGRFSHRVFGLQCCGGLKYKMSVGRFMNTRGRFSADRAPAQTSDFARECEFREVVDLIRCVRQRTLQAVNASLVTLYWEIGRYIGAGESGNALQTRVFRLRCTNSRRRSLDV